MWSGCTLRHWLNSDFYNSAFTYEEKKRILSASNDNADNPMYGTEGCEDTVDKVFCLSIDEAMFYFSGDRDRRAGLTDHAIRQGALKNDTKMPDGSYAGWWWLRSIGDTDTDAVVVTPDGEIDMIGFDVYDDHASVRPACWLSL